MVVCFSLSSISIPHCVSCSVLKCVGAICCSFHHKNFPLLVFYPYCWVYRTSLFSFHTTGFKPPWSLLTCYPFSIFSLYVWKSEGISLSLGQLSHIDLFSCSPGHRKCGLRKHIGHKNIVPYTFNFASQIGNSGICCHHVASSSLCVLNYTLMLYVCLQWSEFVNFDTETFLGNILLEYNSASEFYMYLVYCQMLRECTKFGTGLV